MTFVIPLGVAAALALIGFMASRKDTTQVGPKLPGGKTPALPVGTAKLPAGATPANSASSPAGSLPSTPNTGDTQTVHADDAFDQAVANAIAKHDIPSLIELAKQAEAKGLYTVAKSIRDEIARLQQAVVRQPGVVVPPLIPTPPGPDKPPVVVEHSTPQTLPTYIVKAGDTGEKIAQAYTGNKSRWTELLAPTNPNKQRDPKYGIALYAGERINLPASWPAGVPVLPPVPAPTAPPAIREVPPAPPSLNTYTVVSGDTGEKVAQKFVGDKSRWRELLTVNPTLKSAQYGIALYTGHKINLPSNWPAVPGYSAPAAPVYTPPPPTPYAPPPLPPPPPPGMDAMSLPTPPQSDARTAAQELTSYLQSIGGLAGRWHEDQTQVKGWETRLGNTADGKYGHNDAAAIMQNGLVPVAPYYWPRTNTQSVKDQFITLVKNYAAADPMRADQWNKLLADTIRS